MGTTSRAAFITAAASAATTLALGGTPTFAQGAAPIPLVIGLGDVSLTKLIYLVAYDQGIYAKDGLAVQQYITPRAAEVARRNGVDIPPAFVRESTGDDIPITIEGGVPRMVQMTTSAKAPDRVIIATTDNTARFHIIARREITSLAQLKGKRIGYTELGAITQLMAIEFAHRMGWNPDTDVSLMADGTAFDVLEAGRVDAFVGDEIVQAKAAQLGYNDLLDLSTYHIPLAGSSVNAERTWLATHHEAAQRFIKATVDAIAVVKTNKAAAFASLAKWYNITDPQQQEKLYKQFASLPSKPYPAVDGIDEVRKIYTYREMRIHPATYFYDDTFVGAVDRNGYIESLYK